MTNVLCKAESDTADIFEDLKYICHSTNLISESLKRGCDVTQMSNGDLIITEVKVINTQYVWDAAKQRMVRVTKIV
ncbi:MAG: DUF2671 domain-containing protein [Pseudomonadota bacterium]